MGYTSYSMESRAIRSNLKGYDVKAAHEIFSSKLHESMNPNGLRIRECFDSQQHPNTIAVIFGLDVTGSMGHIPHMLIKNGLPTLMQSIVEYGTPDVAVCFCAIGDHLRDSAPLQVGQFESGDEELDMWLERTWLEGNGGGNGGESYPLLWYFAANHTKTDCWDKRHEKGVIISFGDEDYHRTYTSEYFKDIFGKEARVEGTVTAAELLKEAQERYHVYHISVQPKHDMSGWKEILGNNYREISDYKTIPQVVSEIVLKHVSKTNFPTERQDSQNGDNIPDDDQEVVFVK